MPKHLLLLIPFFLFSLMHAQSVNALKKQVALVLSAQPGKFAVAFKNLQTGQTLYINEHEIFHAASTMKTPVLLEAYKQAAAGKFRLTDSVTIVNDFTSIADSSHFTLSPSDDSEFELYKHAGEKTTWYNLLYQMIINSSNLATNMVVEKVAASNVMTTMRGMGLQEIQVLRGVEDNKAYQKGLNNSVSAYDLCRLFENIATDKVAGAGAMIKILLDQQFNDIIPAKLPATVKVAHKTGFITGIHHDSGIVFLPGGKKYVLVLLSKDLTDEKAGVEAMAKVSEMIYNYVNENKKD